jgi:hypothetical protein
MHLKQMFNKKAYNFNGRFNSAYMGSVLNMLKMSQHLYKREDIVKAYRFLADLIENGSFEWGGTFPLFPEEPKKTLRGAGKSANISTKKDSEKPIASESSDTTPTVQSE